MHLPRSVRSSHWSKASIVWIKNKSNQTISHSYLCKSRSSEEKEERKVTDADKKLYSKYTMCMYFSEVKLRSNGSNIRKNVW